MFRRSLVWGSLVLAFLIFMYAPPPPSPLEWCDTPEEMLDLYSVRFEASADLAVEVWERFVTEYGELSLPTSLELLTKASETDSIMRKALAAGDVSRAAKVEEEMEELALDRIETEWGRGARISVFMGLRRAKEEGDRQARELAPEICTR